MPDGKQQWCASEAEAVRLEQLIALEAAGEIRALQAQPKFDLVVNNVKVCRFTPDFLYVRPDGREQIEEVKGVIRDDFPVRLNLFRALHPHFLFELIKPGQVKGSRALWIEKHWRDRIPD